MQLGYNAMPQIFSASASKTNDLDILYSDKYTDQHRLYSFQSCKNQNGRLVALSLRMRIARKFSTEISLLEHGDFYSIECVNEGNYSLAKDSTIRNLTIFFDMSGVQGLKIYTDNNAVNLIGSSTSLYQYTYNYPQQNTRLIGFSSTEVTKPLNAILTLTPVEWTADPCPVLQPEIPVTQIVIPVVVPPIPEALVAEPIVVTKPKDQTIVVSKTNPVAVPEPIVVAKPKDQTIVVSKTNPVAVPEPVVVAQPVVEPLVETDPIPVAVVELRPD